MFGQLLIKLNAAYESAKAGAFQEAARVAVCDVACSLLEPAPVHAAASAGFDEAGATACEKKVEAIQACIKQAGVQAGGVLAAFAIQLLITNLPTILEYIRDRRAGR